MDRWGARTFVLLLIQRISPLEGLRACGRHIRLWVVPASQLDLVRDVPVALFDVGRVAGVHPEHPRLWRCLRGVIAVLDGELRLPVSALGASTGLSVLSAYPHRLGPPVLCEMPARSISRVSGRAAFRDRQSRGRDERG